MRVKITHLLCAVFLIQLMTGCSAPSTVSESGTKSAPQPDAVSVTETSGSTQEFYHSERGWSVQYSPELIDVQEEQDDVRFIYKGECVGENLVEIRYLTGKTPREVLDEALKGAEKESVSRNEGYIGPNRWSYHAVVETSEEDRDVTTDYTSAEYNGGVLLTKSVIGLTDESLLEGYMDETLWSILDSLKFDHFEPQTEFASVPGVYTKKGMQGKNENTITLKEDHSGVLQTDRRIRICWGSDALMQEESDHFFAYTLEGETLKVKLDGKWVEYQKTGELEQGASIYSDPENVELLNQQINSLYTDATGRVGRIHKMQAFLMELSLHAKQRNPDFKVIPQNCVFLAYEDGQYEKGENDLVTELIDGWGVEGAVGKGTSLEPNPYQRMYVDQARKGKFVSDTTTVSTQTELDNYLKRAKAWNIAPFPKVGGELTETLWPGRRFAPNGDYFWVENPETLGLSDLIDGKREIKQLSDARNYLYNINGRPYDNWQDWDKEEAEFEKGDGDRTRITDSYACGLLVPSEQGKYKPVGEDEEDENAAEAVKNYGDKWDWWWRAEGLNKKDGRKTWLNALRNSDYDVLIIDSFYKHRARPEEQTPLTRKEVESLKYKPDGGRRQVISYLAIGTAEQNRWYCQDDWIWVDPTNKNSFYSMKAGKVRETGGSIYYVPFKDSEVAKQAADKSNVPTWLAFDLGDEYPEEAVVQWWHDDWRDIIIRGNGKYAHKETGERTSSIDRIINQGFDGVYLDNADSCTDENWTAVEEYWANRGGMPTK